MDFSVLSRYDDMLASYFVDGLYLWFRTLRMNSDFVGTTVEEQQIIKVIREEILDSSQVPVGIKDATATFLEFPYFKEFVRDLSKRQAVEFTQHMKRYLYMYAHNAGFEVGSTKRYTGKMEACIVATKDWKAGEQVKYCLGSIAELSEEDDAKLKKEGRDFSVMVSTRKKCSCLFLGPARFMNHDCDANCEFLLIGHNAITFKVRRDIACGEEMTVYYADHYFGENNRECRCTSCERLQQGSFSVRPTEDDENPDTPESAEVDGESNSIRRSQRKRKEISYKDYILHPHTKRARHNSDDKKELSNPLNEITNTSPILNERTSTTEGKDTQTIRRDSKHIEMNLSFICNEKQDTESWVYMPAHDDPRKYVIHGYDPDLISNEQQFHHSLNGPTPGEYLSLPYPPLLPHAYRSIQNQSVKEKTLDFSNKLIADDEDMSIFCNWLDIQSDLSDENDNNTVIIEEIKTNCCSDSKDFVRFRTSEGRQLCARCYRHYKIYGIHWPLRKATKRAKNVRLKAIVNPKPSSRVNMKKSDLSNGTKSVANRSESLSGNYLSPWSSPAPLASLYSSHSTSQTSSLSNLPLLMQRSDHSSFSNFQLPTYRNDINYHSSHPARTTTTERKYNLRPKQLNVHASSTYNLYDIGIIGNELGASNNKVSISTMHPVTKSSMLTMKDSQMIPNNKENKSVYPITIAVTKEELQSIPTITSQYIPILQCGKEWLLAYQRQFDEPLRSPEARMDEELNRHEAKLKYLMNRRQDLQDLKRKYQLLHRHQSRRKPLRELQTQTQDSGDHIMDIGDLPSNSDVQPQLQPKASGKVSTPGSLVDSLSDLQLDSQAEPPSDFESEFQLKSQPDPDDHNIDTENSSSNTHIQPQLQQKVFHKISSPEALVESSSDSQIDSQAEPPSGFGPESQPESLQESLQEYRTESSRAESQSDPSDHIMGTVNPLSDTDVQPQLQPTVSHNLSSPKFLLDSLVNLQLDFQAEQLSDIELEFQPEFQPDPSDYIIDTVDLSSDTDVHPQFQPKASCLEPLTESLPNSQLDFQTEIPLDFDLECQLFGQSDLNDQIIDTSDTYCDTDVQPELQLISPRSGSSSESSVVPLSDPVPLDFDLESQPDDESEYLPGSQSEYISEYELGPLRKSAAKSQIKTELSLEAYSVHQLESPLESQSNDETEYIPNSQSATLSENEVESELEPLRKSRIKSLLELPLETHSVHQVESQSEPELKPQSESLVVVELQSDSVHAHDIQSHYEAENRAGSQEDCLPVLTDSVVDSQEEWFPVSSTDDTVDDQMDYEMDTPMTLQSSFTSDIEPDFQPTPQQKCKSTHTIGDSNRTLDEDSINRLNSIAKAHEPTVIIKTGPPSSRKTKSTFARNSNLRNYKATAPLTIIQNNKKTTSSIARNSSATAPLMITHDSKVADPLERPRELAVVIRTMRAEKTVKKGYKVKAGSQKHRPTQPTTIDDETPKPSYHFSADVDDKIAQALARKNQRYLERQKALTEQSSPSIDETSSNHLDMPKEPEHIPLIHMATPKKVSTSTPTPSSDKTFSQARSMSEGTKLAQNRRKSSHARRTLFRSHHPGQSSRAAVPISIPTSAGTAKNNTTTNISRLVRFSRSN